jgi:hypothetical protein
MRFHCSIPPSQLSHRLCISAVCFGHLFWYDFLFIYNVKAVKAENGDDFL